MIIKTTAIYYFSYIQKALGLLLVLFSLSSCAVKESLFDPFGVSIERTMNRTKVLNSCQITPINQTSEIESKIQQVSSVLNTDKLANSTNFIQDYCSTAEAAIKNNSPPFYILYQQLKIALIV